ncbi:TPA: hypothetical protein ACQVH3_005261, partial [Serratia marcescens]
MVHEDAMAGIYAGLTSVGVTLLLAVLGIVWCSPVSDREGANMALCSWECLLDEILLELLSGKGLVLRAVVQSPAKWGGLCKYRPGAVFGEVQVEGRVMDDDEEDERIIGMSAVLASVGMTFLLAMLGVWLCALRVWGGPGIDDAQ